MLYSAADFLALLNDLARIPLKWMEKDRIDWVVIGPCSVFGVTKEFMEDPSPAIVNELGDRKGTVLIIPGCCGSYKLGQQESITSELGTDVTCVFPKMKDLHEAFPGHDVAVNNCIVCLLESDVLIGDLAKKTE